MNMIKYWGTPHTMSLPRFLSTTTYADSLYSIARGLYTMPANTCLRIIVRLTRPDDLTVASVPPARRIEIESIKNFRRGQAG